MHKRSTARLGFTATGALLMALGAALVIPTAAAASPTTSAPRPTMWVDCDAMSWFDRVFSPYC